MGAFAGIDPKTVDDLFGRAVAADSTRPMLTWYDDGTGERLELSGATLENWVAKTANLLVDGCGSAPGDTAAVMLPPHWQTAAVLLGCWRAGLEVNDSPDPDTPVDVLFMAATPAGGPQPSAGDRFALGLAPLGAPLRDVPAGFADYLVEVRGQGDRFVPYQPIDASGPARRGRSHERLCADAARRAGELGIGPGDRVLIDADAHPDPLDWLLSPLAAGASTVLCARLDPATLAARIDAEKVTVTITAAPE